MINEAENRFKLKVSELNMERETEAWRGLENGWITDTPERGRKVRESRRSSRWMDGKSLGQATIVNTRRK